MYAIVKKEGKQYTVGAGEVITLEKINGNIGDTVAFDEVLMVNDGKSIMVGEPTIDGFPVSGEIVDQYKGKKILVVKKKRRKGYRRIKGHRQLYTDVKITTLGK